MALTQSAWTDTTVDGQLVSICTVVCTTGEHDAYTLKTSTALNPELPWRLVFHSIAAGDGEALPFEIYVGYSSSFALSGDDSTLAVTDGAYFSELYDDVRPAVGAAGALTFMMSPDTEVADVVTTTNNPAKMQIPVAPYYAFNLNGGSALVATTHTFIIIQ